MKEFGKKYQNAIKVTKGGVILLMKPSLRAVRFCAVIASFATGVALEEMPFLAIDGAQGRISFAAKGISSISCVADTSWGILTLDLFI